MKMRLIDVDTLKKQVSEYRGNLRSCHYTPLALSVADDMIDYIDEAPIIEAEPVRHGKWIDKYGNGDLYCSECGAVMERDEHVNHNLYYCYHCGARMDGGV